MRPAAALLAPAVLAACVPGNPDMPLRGDRATAEQAARQFVARRDPVIDPAPVAACIARHAKREEVGQLTAGGDVEATVREIVRRQSTQTCFSDSGVPDFGLELLIG